MVHNGILKETIGISVMVSIVFLAGVSGFAFLKEHVPTWKNTR